MVEDKSLFRKAMDAMVESRSREAQRRLAYYTREYGCNFGVSRKAGN